MYLRLARSFALSLGVLASGLATASAEPRCVIEMFTSQGCSSCPPADRLLAELARDPNVLALSFPVDYWDYIGWKDTLASPAFTARQKAYATARGDGQVYTPQAVVDGISHAVGSDRGEIVKAIAALAARKNVLSVPVQASGAPGAIKVAIGAASGDTPRMAEVWLLQVARTRTVAIGRGENTGSSVTYTNVVRSMMRLGDWTGEARTFESGEKRAPDADGYVVLLQAREGGRPGAILGAAKGPGI